MKVLIEEQSIEHFNLERVENVHLEVNINNRILIHYCILLLIKISFSIHLKYSTFGPSADVHPMLNYPLHTLP
jgi:hypothetical protein